MGFNLSSKFINLSRININKDRGGGYLKLAFNIFTGNILLRQKYMKSLRLIVVTLIHLISSMPILYCLLLFPYKVKSHYEIQMIAVLLNHDFYVHLEKWNVKITLPREWIYNSLNVSFYTYFYLYDSSAKIKNCNRGNFQLVPLDLTKRRVWAFATKVQMCRWWCRLWWNNEEQEMDSDSGSHGAFFFNNTCRGGHLVYRFPLTIINLLRPTVSYSQTLHHIILSPFSLTL